MQAFGKAGSAALAEEANAKERGGNRKQQKGGLELKPGAARGLYAGPVASGRR